MYGLLIGLGIILLASSNCISYTMGHKRGLRFCEKLDQEFARRSNK